MIIAFKPPWISGWRSHRVPDARSNDMLTMFMIRRVASLLTPQAAARL
jgi:hypothetical protein